MAAEKTYRRLPLRDLLTDAEKRSRDLAEHFHVTWLARAVDLHDLSRPLRRRSHYPTLLALLNALQKLLQTSDETEILVEFLNRELEEIRDHARRERLSRS
jgi:C4-dicarboxylate-specific signal transduction histidine kinase